MNYKLLFSIVIFGLALTGCASNPSSSSASSVAEEEQVSSETKAVAATNDSRADQAGDGVICRMEQRVGSHRSRKVCRTVEDIEANMRRTQGGMLRGARTGSASSGGNGN